MPQKTVLLIAGGGTLGSYTADELLNLGCRVDIICLEDRVSDREDLQFYKALANEEYLQQFFKNRHYDGIVNFVHYGEPERYYPIHPLLLAHTDHLIFVSSYRVYADEQHPVTETAPQLWDVSRDERFLETEKYAVSKAKAERFLRSPAGAGRWTIVRPVISFSARRLDLITRSRREVVDMARAGDVIDLPLDAKNLTAGLDWAGNAGKLIAHLLFKEEAIGEAFTVSSAQNLTWGEVADIYTRLVGAKFRWIDTETYLEKHQKDPYVLLYDRLFDRKIDNRKILAVTGLTERDFVSIEDGIRRELQNLDK